MFVAPLRVVAWKRPRAGNGIGSSGARCCAVGGDSVELTRKVEETLMDVEQAPPAPTPISPVQLPVQRELLVYHARKLGRRRGTRAMAEQMFLRVLRNDRTDGRAWVGLGKVRATDGRLHEARVALRDGARECSRNVYILQYWGVLEERAGNIRRAYTLYLAATRRDETHAPAWVALGLWYQRHARDAKAAAECFARGAAVDPSNYYVWHVWGVLERECRRFSAARRCFRRGIEANSKNGATYVVWGALEAQLGCLDSAMRLYRHAHRVAPRNAHAYVAHAAAAERAGDVGQARALLAHARRIRPNDAAPLQLQALLESRCGDIESARECFRQALAVSSSHAPSWHSWACMERELGDLARARELFQHAVWAAPKNVDVVKSWHAWATLELDAGRLHLARRYVAHGLRRDDRSAPLLTLLGTLEWRQGEVTRARESFEAAVKAAPRDRSIWRTYARMERQAGFTDRADAVYQRSLVSTNAEGERLTVAQPLAGDFASTGMWIGHDDLRGRDAANVRNTFSSSGVVDTGGEVAVEVEEERAGRRKRLEYRRRRDSEFSAYA